MTEIRKIQDDFYILANASLADTQIHVLKHGQLFAVFDRHGDIRPLGFENHGLFYQGTRFLSRLHLKINGQSPLLLSSSVREDNDFLAVDLTNPDFEDPRSGFVPRGTIHIARTLCLWEGRYFEKLAISNFGVKPVYFNLRFDFESDFSDIFEVRGMKRAHRGEFFPAEQNGQAVTLRYQGLDNLMRETHLRYSPMPTRMDAGSVEFDLKLPPQETKNIEAVFSCVIDKQNFPEVTFDRAYQTIRKHYEDHTAFACKIETGNDAFNDWLSQSRADLHMLLTTTPHGLYPFAGIPWFSTYFGRDGITTAFETLWCYPEIARGVLNYLAHTQAVELNEAQEAEPGKIIHEQRGGEMAALNEIPFGHYYGSIDSTPLFVMLAGAYMERTGDIEFMKSIWPNIEAALLWMERYGDIDGDQFLEYKRRSPTGLTNQGWKDSEDSVFHADARLAEAPIALCEVQAYAYAAWLSASAIADALGQTAKSAALRETASAFQKKFHAAFWCEENGMYALALDGNKKQCKVQSSNAGHCLFAGIASPAHAASIEKNLMSPAFFSGWGIRTIGAGEARYNPMSYHNGSIWPHDNAMIAYGLGKYGHKEAAIKVLEGIFDSSLFLKSHRLPELFCGFARRHGEGPTLYPVACDPQAWAAGAVFLLLQACLGMRIDARAGQIVFSNPVLPEFLNRVTIRGLKTGQSSIDVHFERHARDVGVTLLHKQGPLEVIFTK